MELEKFSELAVFLINTKFFNLSLQKN
jgi:hypothetical protein